MEYGCRDDNYGGVYANGIITGVETTSIFQIDSNGFLNNIVEDSFAWDSFVLVNLFEVTYVSSTINQNYVAIAEPALPPALTLPLDSVQVWNVSNSDSSNITHLFKLQIGRRTNYSFEITNDNTFRKEANYEVYASEYEHLFRMNTPPEDGQIKILIKYYTSSGDVLQARSDSFTIKDL